jgi:potassium intermediate/small conductance calcium-activated channel subfamily N protein 2
MPKKEKTTQEIPIPARKTNFQLLTNKYNQKDNQDEYLEMKIFSTLFQKKKEEVYQRARIQDSRVTKVIMHRILLIDQGIMAFALMSLGLSILEYELEFEYEPLDPKKQHFGDQAKPMLWMLFLISSILVMLNLSRKLMVNKFKELTTGKRSDATLMSRFMTLIRCIALFCHPSPFFLGKKLSFENVNLAGENLYHDINDIFHILQVYKVYIVVRALLTSSAYQSDRAQRVW